MNQQKRLKIFTWHIHGSYLYYLAQGNYDIYIPVNESKSPGYGGRGSFAFGDNVKEVPVAKVRQMEFDCILYQSSRNYLEEQYDVLSEEQMKLPRIYIEHDPPRGTPTDTKHPVDDPHLLLVHVTHFNNLMWDNNRTPTKVIEHGVVMPNAAYKGDLERGIVVINNLATRGRRLGLDVFEKIRTQVPLDLVGMGSKELGGLGEIPLAELPDFISSYRFFFNPIRYTSMGLSVCEAMMVGMPIIGMATTEMPTVIENGVSGYLHTDTSFLVDKMNALLSDKDLATSLGAAAKKCAMEKFNIDRFTKEWEQVFNDVVKKHKQASVLHAY